MAAYAAAVSLMHIIDLLKNHPSPPISLDKQQLHSLTEAVTFMQEFLESYVSPFRNSDEADPLEIRIAEAVYAAEDVIESYIVDNIPLAAASTTRDDDDGDNDNDNDYDDCNGDDNDDGDDKDEDNIYDDFDGEVMGSYIVDNIHLATAGTTHDDKDDDDDEQIRYFNFYEGQQTKIEAMDMIKKEAVEMDYAMESYTVGSIQLAAAEAHHKDKQIRYFNFYQDLQKVIEAIDIINKEVMEMELEMEMVREKGGLLEAEVQGNVSVEGGFKSTSIERKSEMVGFDDEVLQLKERLVRGDSNRQIIPIVGMGGIGKTTLARNIFADKLIKEHFDICIWATISQDPNIEQTLREVLSQCKGKGHSSGDKSIAELGEELHKNLFGMRYLVVMDDIWSIEVWDKMKFFFPDCNEGSRIMVTTRMSNLIAHLTNSSNSLCMSFLNEVDSWTLFSKSVFGDEGSVPDLHLQLRETGENIVEKCKGLPLSIVVIGGLLGKSELTQEYWKYIEKNLSSIVNLDNEEYCLRVLKLSYNHLPAHLKPCFLYMGVFDEDSEIKVSTIINLWVSEGFVKPKKNKNLETVAREYFQELVDRNLVLTTSRSSGLEDGELGWIGMIKLCKMHDLVRDVSLREAEKQRFYYVYNEEHNQSSHRRVVIPDKTGDIYGPQIMVESSQNQRTYICHDIFIKQFPDFRLLRTLHTTCDVYTQKHVFQLVNSRLLAISVKEERGNDVLHSSISRLWSLHTLLVYSDGYLEGPVEFWNMHQLKHVEFKGGLYLQPPPLSDNDNNIVILENLHTLIGMVNFHLNEGVVTRIPNLTIFDVIYGGVDLNREVHSLSYLQRLSKLESFRCFIQKERGENLERICFPKSLNQISLIDDDCYGSPQIEWDDVLQKIGRLPFLEELRIKGGFFKRGEWETVQGQFPRLKSLQLIGCCDLKKWTVSEASHFPLLQNLSLERLRVLEEIPLEIGEIATLERILLDYCSESAVVSAKKIVEGQEDLYGEEQLSFGVLALVAEKPPMESSTSPNFQVFSYYSKWWEME